MTRTRTSGTSNGMHHIIDEKVRELAQKIDTTRENIDHLLQELVRTVKQNCAQPAVKERYANYSKQQGSLERYPLEREFARSFDPLQEESSFVNAWFAYGMVVGKNIIPKKQCTHTIDRMRAELLNLSNGACDLLKPETYNDVPLDLNSTPFISRGFFELYHDDSLAQIRQSVRLYLHHVLIWGRADLWASFDRLGIKLPRHPDSSGLPLHVDQNPNIHPEFQTIQGVIALTDCAAEQGSYVGVPGSRSLFTAYGSMAKNNGEYVELDLTHPIATQLQQNLQPIPLLAGDVLSWDSRTTHANAENKSQSTRFVMYQAAGVAQENNTSAKSARQEAVETGIGSNVREALMHASKKPRYSNPALLQQLRKPEQLTVLGKLLYGQMSYETI